MATLEDKKDEFSDTEKELYEEFRSFKEEDSGVGQWATEKLDNTLESLADRFEETKPGEVVDKVAGVILDLLNNVSIWSVREHKIWENFEEAGFDIEALEDVQDLSLEEIEEGLGKLKLKYRLAASVQGMSVGTFGLGGVLAGLPTIIAMSLRAIAEYATYYGFDITKSSERPYILMALSVATSQGETRQELVERAEDHALSADGKIADRSILETGEAVERLAVRLVRGKISQSVPLAGALIGAGYNQAFVEYVCETAQQLMRHRWLIRNYL